MRSLVVSFGLFILSCDSLALGVDSQVAEDVDEELRVLDAKASAAAAMIEASQVFGLEGVTQDDADTEEDTKPNIRIRASDEKRAQTLERLTRISREATGEADNLEDGVFDPIQSDASCANQDDADCWEPPQSTIETEEQEQLVSSITCSYGGNDPDEEKQAECKEETTTTKKNVTVDKHWGSDEKILLMRDKLRNAGTGRGTTTEPGEHPYDEKRIPIFLMPGLASTRLVAWKFKSCPHKLLSDIKVQDYVWLNINLLIQMGTIDVQCWEECMMLGVNQTDADDVEIGCKLRPDEGLDAISSLAPGSFGSQLLVGGTNTVYAWLIQWLADNLGYDVSNIVGLPYDWRLSPDMMEKRDGFLTLTRRRIEAVVKSNGSPGIMVAHSMGNVVFRYFLEWLRQEMREEAYQKFVKQAERRAQAMKHKYHAVVSDSSDPGWMSGLSSGFFDWRSYFGDERDGEPNEESGEGTASSDDGKHGRHWQLWELAQVEGDENYLQWLQDHIWTYVGLSAPLLGAVNPLRAVISGENMGLPIPDETARRMELTFGSTQTVNPISSKMAFCDSWGDRDPDENDSGSPKIDLFCLDELVREVESSQPGVDPWAEFPQLCALLKDRVDWDSDFPMISIVEDDEDASGENHTETTLNISPKDVQNGIVFEHFSRLWNEKAKQLVIKREQLEQSWWNTNTPNILNRTWDRPHIKNIIMAYGVDLPTEAGYQYRKKDDPKKEKSDFDGVPKLEKVIWENANGLLTEETIAPTRGKLTDAIIRKKTPKKKPLGKGKLLHSGDGTIPYLSLSWAHTWLLHAIRAKRYTEGLEPGTNILDDVEVSHRPQGAMDWIDGPPPRQDMMHDDAKSKREDADTGTSHPHGTKYKPEMVKFHNVGTSRKTGTEYSTTVIEAYGVEHKETTRNYDILAACFTEVLKHMNAEGMV